MELYLKNVEIKNGKEIFIADIFLYSKYKNFYVDSAIVNGRTLMHKDDKVWTQVHKIKNTWYAMSPWSLALEEGKLEEYINSFK